MKKRAVPKLKQPLHFARIPVAVVQKTVVAPASPARGGKALKRKGSPEAK